MNKKELNKFLKENFECIKTNIIQYELDHEYKKTFSIKENYKIIIELDEPILDFKKLNKLKSLFKTKNIEMSFATAYSGCSYCIGSDQVNVTFELNTNIIIDKLKINKNSYTYE